MSEPRLDGSGTVCRHGYPPQSCDKCEPAPVEQPHPLAGAFAWNEGRKTQALAHSAYIGAVEPILELEPVAASPAEGPHTELMIQIKGKIAAGEAGQYEAAILWQELEKLKRTISDKAGKFSPATEEEAKAFYDSGEYDGDYDFSLSSACQFASAFANIRIVAQPVPGAKVKEVAAAIQDEWTNGASVTVEDAALAILRPYLPEQK